VKDIRKKKRCINKNLSKIGVHLSKVTGHVQTIIEVNKQTIMKMKMNGLKIKTIKE
jgi:hypothetical protein